MTDGQDQRPAAGESLDRHAQEILTVLGEALQMEGLAFDSGKKCVFTIDQRFNFIAYLDTAHTGSIILNVPLGYLPAGSRRGKLLEAMMTANFGWEETEGGTLGLDETTGMLALSYLIPLPMQEKGQIIDIVSKLLSPADHWMRQIEEAKQGDGEAAGGAAPMMRI